MWYATNININNRHKLTLRNVADNILLNFKYFGVIFNF